jgi:hypothetical protein
LLIVFLWYQSLSGWSVAPSSEVIYVFYVRELTAIIQGEPQAASYKLRVACYGATNKEERAKSCELLAGEEETRPEMEADRFQALARNDRWTD